MEPSPSQRKKESSSEESSSEEDKSKKSATSKSPSAAKPASTPKSAKSTPKSSAKKGEESSEESSSSEEEVKVNGNSGKRKREGDQGLTPENKKIQVKTPNTFPKANKKDGQKNVPFRRVVEEEVEVDPRVCNNSFEAKKGSQGDWGERANNVLKFTKGKSFRHEKTKKKRGSYCGGAISTTVNSIKFDSE